MRSDTLPAKRLTISFARVFRTRKYSNFLFSGSCGDPIRVHSRAVLGDSDSDSISGGSELIDGGGGSELIGGGGPSPSGLPEASRIGIVGGVGVGKAIHVKTIETVGAMQVTNLGYREKDNNVTCGRKKSIK